MFNELVIKNTPVKKQDWFFVFVEGFHLLHGQFSLWKVKTVQCKVSSKDYHSRELNFLVHFNFVLTT